MSSARPKVVVPPEALQQFINYYFETCERYRVTPQPAVINAVRSAAQDPRKLKSVSLRRQGIGNGDVFALAEVLSKFYIIRELDLRDNAITDEGVRALLMTARAQLTTALKDRLPPSQFKASYLLSSVQISGNRITDPSVVADLNAHLQLLLKEQLKIVAHHVRDHVRQQSLNNPSNTDASVLQLEDLRAGMRSLSLPGSVTPRVQSVVKQRGGSIDHGTFVDLVHSELLSQSKLNNVDPRQAQILQDIAAQRDPGADDDTGTVLSGMSSLTDSSHNTASVLTGSPKKNPKSERRKRAQEAMSADGTSTIGDDDDDGSESMSMSMSMGTTMTGMTGGTGVTGMTGTTAGTRPTGSISLSMGDSDDDDDSDEEDTDSDASEDGSSGSLDLDGSDDDDGSADSESMSLTMSMSMAGTSVASASQARTNKSSRRKSRAMSIDELAATYDGNNHGRGRHGGQQGMPLLESRRLGGDAIVSATDAPFRLEIALVDLILPAASAGGVADRVTVTFDFDGDSQQVTHNFLKRRASPATAEFRTSLHDLAAPGKPHDAATLQGFIWSRSTTVGCFRIEVRPLARAWALKQGGVVGSTLRLERRLTVFQGHAYGADPVGNIELGLLFEPREEPQGVRGSEGALVTNSGGPETGYGDMEGLNPAADNEVDLELNLSSRRIYSLAETGFNWEPLMQIVSLDLSKNQFAVLSQATLSSPILQSLRHVDLSRNNVERIDPDAFEHMPLVEKLNLSHNRLSRCHGFGTLRHLRELNLAHNRIRLVGGLHTAQELQRLDLSHNHIQSAIALRPISLNTKLHTLIVHGNPMATENRLYRASIIGLLPGLAVLDGRPMPRNTVKYAAMQKAAKKVAAQQEAADRERQRQRRIGNLGSSRQRRSLKAIANNQLPAAPTFNVALFKAVPKIEVRVVSAKHLLCDDGSIGDAYVHLRYGEKEKRTETLTIAKDPVWSEEEATFPLTLKRDCAQILAAAWNEDRRTGDTLYGKHTVDLVPVVEELQRLQREQENALPKGARLETPIEIKRTFRLEGNPLLKVSPTLQLAFSIPLEKQLQLQVARETKGDSDEVKAMKKKLKDFKQQQAAIMRLSKPSRTYNQSGSGANEGASSNPSSFTHVKPGKKLQVPPTFRTKLYGPRKTIGPAKEQIRAQARRNARNRAARNKATLQELNSELAKVSLGQKKSELRQTVELEKVSNQLMATRKKLAEYATFQPQSQSRRSQLEMTLATPMNITLDPTAQRSAVLGASSGNINSAQQKFVLARRLREWIEHMQEEQATAATGLKVLVRMADSGGAALTEAKLVGFREQVADCGLLKPVTVGEEVYQATANDAKASGAVDSLVRHISMLQAAIRHLLSLLETAVEKAGGAPGDEDLEPVREYVAFLRDSVLGRHLGARAKRQPQLEEGDDAGASDYPQVGNISRQHSHQSFASSDRSGAVSPRSGRGQRRSSKNKNRKGGGSSRSSRSSRGRRGKRHGRRGEGEESLFSLFNKRMGEEIPDSSAGGQSMSQSYDREEESDEVSGSASRYEDETEGTRATTEASGSTGTAATSPSNSESEEEYDDDAGTTPTSGGGETLYEEETEESEEEEEEEDEVSEAASTSAGGSLMEEETVYESDSAAPTEEADSSMY